MRGNKPPTALQGTGDVNKILPIRLLNELHQRNVDFGIPYLAPCLSPGYTKYTHVVYFSKIIIAFYWRQIFILLNKYDYNSSLLTVED